MRNLLLGCTTFGEILEGAPGLSRSLLSQRLKDLERDGILTSAPNPGRRGSVYRLTEAGAELFAVCDALGTWGTRWLEVAPTGIDPGIVLWAVAKCMDRAALPDRRVVVRFDLRGHRKRYWLVVQKPAPELCRKHPGFDEDLVVTSDPASLAEWHMGRRPLRQALAFEGPPRLARAFARWGGQTPFADVAPALAR